MEELNKKWLEEHALSTWTLHKINEHFEEMDRPPRKPRNILEYKYEPHYLLTRFFNNLYTQLDIPVKKRRG